MQLSTRGTMCCLFWRFKHDSTVSSKTHVTAATPELRCEFGSAAISNERVPGRREVQITTGRSEQQTPKLKVGSLDSS